MLNDYLVRDLGARPLTLTPAAAVSVCSRDLFAIIAFGLEISFQDLGQQIDKERTPVTMQLVALLSAWIEFAQLIAR